MRFMVRMVVVLDVKGRTFVLAVKELAKRKMVFLVQPVAAVEIVSFVLKRKKRRLNKIAFFLTKARAYDIVEISKNVSLVFK